MAADVEELSRENARLATIGIDAADMFIALLPLTEPTITTDSTDETTLSTFDKALLQVKKSGLQLSPDGLALVEDHEKPYTVTVIFLLLHQANIPMTLADKDFIEHHENLRALCIVLNYLKKAKLLSPTRWLEIKMYSFCCDNDATALQMLYDNGLLTEEYWHAIKTHFDTKTLAKLWCLMQQAEILSPENWLNLNERYNDDKKLSDLASSFSHLEDKQKLKEVWPIIEKNDYALPCIVALVALVDTQCLTLEIKNALCSHPERENLAVAIISMYQHRLLSSSRLCMLIEPACAWLLTLAARQLVWEQNIIHFVSDRRFTRLVSYSMSKNAQQHIENYLSTLRQPSDSLLPVPAVIHQRHVTFSSSITIMDTPFVAANTMVEAAPISILKKESRYAFLCQSGAAAIEQAPSPLSSSSDIAGPSLIP